MLSDTSIQRDENYSMPRRCLLKARAIFSRRARQRRNAVLHKKFEGEDFTIFSNNCLGGVIYHDAGKRFSSPLVNTAMDGEDFIRFLERPQHYLEQEMTFITWPGHNYPIARIEDIEIRFVHYHNEVEARNKFSERKNRINWNNIVVVATNHDGLGSPALMERFDKLPYKKIMYVSKEYPEYDWAICVPQFRGRFQVRIMTNFANFSGQRYYETAFDLADWLVKK